MTRSKKLLLRAAVSLLMVFAVGASAVVYIGPGAIVQAPNRGMAPGPSITPAPHRCGNAVGGFAVGPPAATLSVSMVEPASANNLRGTMFVLHGIRDRKENMLGWARHLSEARYRVFVIDSRGHGNSSGDWLTYGVQESRDLSQLLDQLEKCSLVEGPVGVMGVSYGAATAVQWAAREPRVKAVVSVASFSSLRAVVPLYFRRMFPFASRLVPSFVLDATIKRAGRVAGFDPSEANPLAAIARMRTPVLLIHGRNDVHIPASHSEAMHAAAPDHSTLLVIDGENHDTVADDASGQLWRDAIPFLAKQVL